MIIELIERLTEEMKHWNASAGWARIDHAQTRRRFRAPGLRPPHGGPPSKVPCEAAVRAFEETIAAFKLRENAPRVAEDIREFKM